MRVINLASGSKGNCTLVESDKASILIDCGLDSKKIESLLEEVGSTADKIQAIFITHTHTDHIKGVTVFAKKHNVKVFATDKCWEEGKLQKIELVQRGFLNFEPMTFEDFSIVAFELPHDAVQTVGYSIQNCGKKFSIATDLGVLSAQTLSNLQGSDLIFIESNYDEGMLKNGPYPYVLKQRIASGVGHLSNEDCGNAIAKLVKLGTKHFVLMHLSENNNLPELAYGTVKNVLKNLNLDTNIYIGMSFQNRVGSNFLLKPVV